MNEHKTIIDSYEPPVSYNYEQSYWYSKMVIMKLEVLIKIKAEIPLSDEIEVYVSQKIEELVKLL